MKINTAKMSGDKQTDRWIFNDNQITMSVNPQLILSTAASINSCFYQQVVLSTTVSINSWLYQQLVLSTVGSINSWFLFDEQWVYTPRQLNGVGRTSYHTFTRYFLHQSVEDSKRGSILRAVHPALHENVLQQEHRLYSVKWFSSVSSTRSKSQFNIKVM